MQRDAFEKFFCGPKYTPAQNAFELWTLLGVIEGLAPWLDVVIEIGVYKGGTLRFWREVVGSKGLVVGVDTNERGHVDELQRQYHGDPAVALVVGDSTTHATVEAVRAALQGRKAGLLFIDGGHDYKCVRSDYARYKGFVKPGGLMVFHDIENKCIRRVWDEALADGNCRGSIELRGMESHKGIGVLATRWEKG